MDPGRTTSDFPNISLCPKRETGVTNFLTKNPNYDGRGIVIAIFDSGVDPGANGLRETTTGLPKVIERYDCSGAGDCDTSTVVKPSADGTITGLSGRKLKIPSTWNNPSQEYHIGVKPVFELYTPKVKERMEGKRRELHWDPQHRQILAEANRVLTKEQALNKTADSLTPIEKLAKEDLEAQVEVLQNLDKKYKDLGPLLDCVVFNTGSEWVTCLSDDGDLESGILLTEYKIKQDFAPLTQADQMNISCNVWENGNRLEIVGLCGSHGSHVSGIAAGYFPENPDLNGVAPGAQIISFTIGDGRLGSMETGTALVRAMCYVMQNSHRIHLINMSYGEHAHWSASARIGELMKEVVDKHGVIWVASGGNHGPALSTVGTPPWIMTNTIIGVAAYVSPDMMQASYSLREKLPSMPYTWSSRGPTLDGDMGISVCAPGGAITSVPNFTLRSAQLMNGTSMAAPHLAGCIALMLCGAVDRKFKWTPYSVKKALENTAQPLSNAECYAQGKGLVQVEKAYEGLESLSKLQERDVRFNVTVNGGTTSSWPMRGIYIRDPPPDKAKEYSVGVEPVFFNEDQMEPETKINFRMNLCLVSDAPWVQVPKYFDLANMVRNFNIKVDPEGLPYGLSYAKVQALDVNDMRRGPVFEVCVTVVKPHIPAIGSFVRPTLEFGTVRYEPGKIMRHFMVVPKGSTWAVLNLKLLGGGAATGSDTSLQGSTARFVIHAMSVLGGEWCKSLEFYKMIQLQPMEETNLYFKVVEAKVLELVIARWWAEPNENANLSSTISFRSLALNKPEIVMSAADAWHKVSIYNSFGTEDFSPSAVLKHQMQLLRPTDMKVICLSDPRDTLPPGRVIYELQCTYNFSISRATEITLNCSLLSDTLYESAYESQLWMLFDSNKRYLATGDAYPTKWNTKVEKGDYIARLQIRHEKREALDRFQVGGGATNGGSPSSTWSGDSQIPTMPVILSMKLPSTISLDTFLTQYEIQDYKIPKKGSGWSTQLKKESSVNAFISSYIPDKTLKTLPGTSTLYFQGTFTATKDENGKKLSNYPLKLCVPEPQGKPKSSPPSKESSTDKTKLDEMNDQLRDVQINWLSKVTPPESRQLYNKLVENFDSHLPLHVARLQSLDSLPSSPTPGDSSSVSEAENEVVTRSFDETSNGNKSAEKKEKKSVDTYQEIITVADKILDMVDRSALLAYFGTKPSANSSQVDATKTKQNMEKQKTAVIEALVKKGCALAELYNLQTQSGSSSPDTSQAYSTVTVEMLDEILFEVQKFAEITETRVVEFGVQHAIARGHYGRALRLMNKKMEADATKWNSEGDAVVLELYGKLNWTHAIWMLTSLTPLKYPKDFRPF